MIKNYFLAIFLLSIIIKVHSQEQVNNNTKKEELIHIESFEEVLVNDNFNYLVDENNTYASVEEEPQFKGGENEFLKFVDSIIVLPKEIIEEEVSGNKCYVSFIVDEKGEISNIEIARGILDCDACNIEAIRIIEQSKDKWSPAKVNGKPVKYRHIQIIKFNLK